MSRPRHFEGDAAPAPPKRRRSWKQRTVLTAGFVLVFASLGCLSLAGYTLMKYNSIERYDDLDIDEAPPGEPRNYLVVGSDSRVNVSAEAAADNPGQRSDTIMIVRIDPESEQADVLSLPRDLVVPIAGTGERRRINAAYSMGTPDEGRQRLIDTIRDNFAIDIHHYVEIDFQGFARLVDAVGGIRLYFSNAVRDTAVGLYQFDLTCVTLPGDQALAFVRSRHLEYMTPQRVWRSDGTGDLGRITRQQIFMQQAIAQTVDSVQSNPLRLTELIDIGTDSVGLDGQIGLNEIRELADRFRDFDTAEGLHTYSLPVIENGDGATVSVNEREAEPILNRFRGLDPGEVSAGSVSVTVLNGTGQQNQAVDVAGALDEVGFDVVETGNALLPHERTTVYYRSGDDAYALRVARHVTGGAALVVNDELDAGHVQLVTGADFSTIHSQPTPLDQMPTTTTSAPAAGGSAPTTQATTTTTSPPTTERPTTTTTAVGYQAAAPCA